MHVPHQVPGSPGPDEKAAAMAQQAIVGEKVGMTQVWAEDNRIVPVTVLRVEPARVVQVKTTERDGYTALQVTYGHKDAKKLSKPEAGHFAKAGVAPGRRLVELRLESVDGFSVGQEITVDMLVKGQKVDVTAVSRGKGTAGVMKRHNFKGSRSATHGTHEYQRHGGAIGTNMTPGRVFPGLKMPGQHGNQKITVQSIRVAKVLDAENLVLVQGSVPGSRESIVTVRGANKAKAQA